MLPSLFDHFDAGKGRSKTLRVTGNIRPEARMRFETMYPVARVGRGEVCRLGFRSNASPARCPPKQ